MANTSPTNRTSSNQASANPASTIQISVINASTVISDADVPAVVDALQQQVTNDFGPIWGVNAILSIVPGGSQPPAGSWWLTILDDADQAGALGYHDLTSEGLPLSKVFAATDLKYGSSWSVTASHELLEMLVDPNINLTVLMQTDSQTAGTLYAYEVCDACEDDSFGYKIGTVLVSDFVYPSWFETFRKAGSTQFDQGKSIDKPFELIKGGYIGTFVINSGTGWQQTTPDRKLSDTSNRGAVGSRRERRAIPRSQWVESRPHREVVERIRDYKRRIQTIEKDRKLAA
jgi:hypothetical protein